MQLRSYRVLEPEMSMPVHTGSEQNVSRNMKKCKRQTLMLKEQDVGEDGGMRSTAAVHGAVCLYICAD